MERFHDGRAVLQCGDCREVIQGYEAESFDALVTDPPYHLKQNDNRSFKRASPDPVQRASIDGDSGFMNMKWDGGSVAFEPATWAAFLRVLKPGGHLVAFGAPKNVHRMTCAIEDAGFEIRDVVMWLFGSGFPKSHNIGDGWGTALKPAYEPIILARKPLVGTVAENAPHPATNIRLIFRLALDHHNRESLE